MSQGDENSKNRGAKEVANCVSQWIPPRTLAPSRDSCMDANHIRHSSDSNEIVYTKGFHSARGKPCAA